MLNEVLVYLNNYFFEYSSGAKKYSYSKDIAFTSTGTMTGDFTDTFLAGEYVLIENTRLNDGVYKISAIDDTTITIDATLDLTIDTEASITTTITKCYIPKDLLAIIAEIKTYNTNVTDGVSSESQGNRSISYSANGTASSGWQNAFGSRLAKYRKVRW